MGQKGCGYGQIRSPLYKEGMCFRLKTAAQGLLRKGLLAKNAALRPVLTAALPFFSTNGASKKPWGMTDDKWDEIDLKALSAIHLCVSNEVLREVAKETIVAGLWLKLN